MSTLTSHSVIESRIVWLKRHESRERRLSSVLREYFRDQADRIAHILEEFDDPTPEIVDQIFRAEDEHELLMETVRSPLLNSMAIAANETLERANRKDTTFDFGESLVSVPFDFPPEVVAGIKRQFQKLAEQDYWRKIQTETKTQLTDLIEDGMNQGANSQRIARRLRNEIGGFEARKRAVKIARTETTGALNSGHEASRDYAESLGLRVTKTWSATGDNDVRDSHDEVDGTTVANKDKFLVGGNLAPYPGHWSLPADERISCRCSVFEHMER